MLQVSSAQQLTVACSCRNDLLKKVERLVAANPDIMKMEIRHAQDGDYRADIQVCSLHGVLRYISQCVAVLTKAHEQLFHEGFQLYSSYVTCDLMHGPKAVMTSVSLQHHSNSEKAKAVGTVLQSERAGRMFGPHRRGMLAHASI